ncbi:FKBP-type peptidyl-prolyl cis-trans isomerase [Desulfofustis glycolicus]|uniref:Peptidyl-prolyl cis-trans isomerase n=1 Tax=Desulfofustis glycolicus DSM 9705 TaxID=1121409 RepID=A0A1M5Y5U4_9BACT|nr:FKBP-type peptidyl-prolyl cis-trans isomerase [Desulfofustis glycolicus]MCB2215015.1 FKBP-type peptidyl-prolyl cis-trans isomerase [Desulfobulbaceae bacterium]SHI07279.1 FKBP-type peptidyl-prolyl cis-trans isomerase FklB [Desulfofustis glycolicus DSM 9705]
MKNIMAGLALGLFLVPVTITGAAVAADASLETQKDKISYSMGLDLGNYLNGLGDKIDLAIIKQGMDDGFTGAEPKLSTEEIEAAQQEFAAAMKAEQEAMLAEMQQKNTAAGQAFLEANKKSDGVTVTESGLQYEVLKEGDGKKPAATDKVKVDYVGTLISGDEFDSSIKRGEPAVFTVNQVIPGWSEALQLMSVGSKYRVVIPPELAYGEKGASPVIEPNSVLVFEIDLLGIEE